VHLLRRIERYLRASGVAPTRFGRDAAADPRLVFDMRFGRQVGPELGDRLDAYLGDQEKQLAEKKKCRRR
jgi:hypothetical protein